MVRRSKKTSALGAHGSAMQYLNIVEIELNYRLTHEMQSIRRMSVVHPWHTICYEPEKMCIAMFLGEFLFNVLRHEGRNDNLFNFLTYSLKWMDESNKGIANFHLVMLMRLTRFLGIWPAVDEERPFGRVFDMLGGCYVETIPAHGQYISADDAQYMPLLLKMNYMQMWRVHITREQRRHMLDVIVHYYRLHVPGFANLESIAVLGEIFD